LISVIVGYTIPPPGHESVTLIKADIPTFDLGDVFSYPPPDFTWGESVFNIKFPTPDWSDFSLGDVIARAQSLAKSRAFLSDLAQQTADRTETTIFVQGVGLHIPQNTQELLANAAAQAQAQAEARIGGTCP